LSLWGGQYRNYIALKIGYDLEGRSHQFLGGTEENHKTLSQDSRCPGWDLNQASASYWVGMRGNAARSWSWSLIFTSARNQMCAVWLCTSLYAFTVWSFGLHWYPSWLACSLICFHATGEAYLRVLLTSLANGTSHVYILMTCIPEMISFISRTRSSVRIAVFRRYSDVFFPRKPANSHL
jgi:hypothetical protein